MKAGPLAGRWVLTRRAAGGHKARFVVKGFLEPRSDDQCSYAPTSALSSCRVVLSHVAAKRNWRCCVADVSQAFLYAGLHECKGQQEVSIEPPEEAGEEPDTV